MVAFNHISKIGESDTNSADIGVTRFNSFSWAGLAPRLLIFLAVNVYRRISACCLKVPVTALALLFLLTFSPKSDAADLVVSNNAIICVFGDSFMQSDAAGGMVTGYRFPDYLESYFQLNYPNSNIHLFNISRSGGNMEDVLTNRLPAAGLSLWAYQFNNYQHIGICQPTDNGSLNSNQMYAAMGKVFSAPGLLSDGNDTLVTHSGWCATNTIQWIGMGDPPGADTNGGFLTIKARNDASVNAGWNLGIRGVDSYNMLSNSWVPDWDFNAGRNIQYVFPSGIEHFLAGGGLSWCMSFLRGITTDTNISTATVDWNGSVVATNHCVVSGVTQSGNVLTFQRKDDRLPMAWDVPDGVITNDARPAFLLNASDADYFKYTLQVRNLPAGMYAVLIDGTPVATLSDATLSSGWNMFTNMVGPIWAQRKEVLGRIRDKEHINRVSLLPRAVDGTGMYSYFSAISGKWGSPNFFRGDALISGLSPNVSNVFSLDALTAQAAQPTNHTFSIMPLAPTAIVKASALTNALNVPVVLDGTSSLKATNYYWEQISPGLPVLDIIGQDRAKPMLISVTNPGTYTFRLTVSDGQTSNSAQIALTFVQPTGRTMFVDGQLTANCLNNNYSIANRNGSGSDGMAYTNIQSAVNVSLPGDLIYIRGGLYTNTPANPNQNLVCVTRSGTATAPIRYEAYNNESVVLGGWGFSDADTNADGLADGPNYPAWRQQLFLIPTNVNYILVKGLELTNSEGGGLTIEGNFCYAQECVSHDNWGDCFDVARMQAATNTLTGTVLRWCEAYRSRHAYGFQFLLETSATFGFMSDCAIVDCISHHNGYQPDGREVLPIQGDPQGGGNSDGINCLKYFADNANFVPTYGVRNWGTNFYFVRDIVWNNCDDGIDLSCANSLVEDCRSLFNGPTGTMGYKLFKYVQGMTYRGDLAYGNLGRGFELRIDTNSNLSAYNNSSFKNLQQGMWIAGIDTSSVLFATNNVAAFNGGPDFPLNQSYNWAGDGDNGVTLFRGNPMIVNTNLALSSAFLPGWTVRQKHDSIESQIRRALSPAVGSPLLSAGAFIPSYDCPRADNDPISPMPLTAPGRHWKVPQPNLGAFDLQSAGSTKPAPPTNLRSVTNF
jgi:hypothetical protein